MTTNEHTTMAGLAQWLRRHAEFGPLSEEGAANLRRWADEVEAASLQRGDVEGLTTKIRELRDTQGMPGNLFDGYMRGLYNGLELALCVIENRDPEYASRLAAPQPATSHDVSTCPYFDMYQRFAEAAGYPHEKNTLTSPEEYVADLKRKADAFEAAPQPQPAGVPQQLSDEQIYDLWVLNGGSLNGNNYVAFARAVLATSPSAPAAQPAPEIESNPMGGAILRGEAASKFREAMDGTDGVQEVPRGQD